jgi:hypothetical protein
MSGTHTITEYPLPTITHLTGSTYQIVTLGEAIEPVKYTTMHATGASVTGLPDGLSGWWGDNKYTISGTPSVAGAFDYAVTAISAPQCTGANANHHGTVLSQSPSPCLGTAKTFNFGGYTWSDCIYINNLSYYCTYTTNSSGPTYYIYEGVQYVNPTCINKIKTVSCDAELGWSFPAYDQMPYQTWIGDEFNTAAGVRGLLVSGLYLGAYNATAGTQNGTAISLLCGATTGSKKCYSGFDEATWPEVQTVIRCIKKQ